MISESILSVQFLDISDHKARCIIVAVVLLYSIPTTKENTVFDKHLIVCFFRTCFYFFNIRRPSYLPGFFVRLKSS